MLQPLDGAPEGVIAFKAVGKVTSADYEDTLVPAVDAARKRSDRLRFVYELGPEFEGTQPGASWEDLKLGGRNFSHWDRCAVVTDQAVLGDAIRAIGVLMPARSASSRGQLPQALAWAAA